MNNNKLPNGRIANYTRAVIKWRWLVLLATMVIVMAGGYGAKNLSFFSGYRIWFAPDNPNLQAFDKLEKTYTKNDNILIAVVPANGKVFTSESMELLSELAEEAWKIPFAIRVDAITNYQYSTAEEDDLWVRDLVSEEMIGDQEQLDEAKIVALVQPALKDRLIKEEADIAGVNVTIQIPDDDANAVIEAAQYTIALRDRLQEKYPGSQIKMTGMVMLNNAFAEVGQQDMSKLTPLMFALMLLIIFISLRSFSGTFTTFLIIIFSTIVAMGIGGWFYVPLTPMSLAAPTIIMTLAIADSIHIIMTILTKMREGKSKVDAIVESMRINFQPVFLTSVTTAIGFISLNWVKVPPINHLGNMTAVGVIMAFLFSVFTLPALLSILPMKAGKKKTGDNGFSDKFSNWVIRNRKAALYGSIIFTLVMSSFIFKNELNDRYTEYFDHSIPFRTENDFISENLTSAYQMEFSLRAGGSGSIAEPDYLENVEKFAIWLRTLDQVSHVSSLTDVMKRLNMNLHADDSAYYRIPESRELAAQYLLLYEMSLPYGLDLNNQINVDKSSTRVSVVLQGNTDANMIREIAELSEAWLRDNVPPVMFSNASSPAVMFAYISRIALVNMLTGTTVALILISLLLIIALRHLKIGLYSLVPNLVPIAIGFGFWGIINGQINMGMAPVIGMTLGIVVDDTIHFLTKYLRGRREDKLSPEEAIRHTIKTVGPALVTTTIVLVSGFSVLTFSAFSLNSDMALMTAITIAIALVADFVFLPAILLYIDKDKYPSAQETARESKPVITN